MIIIAIAADGTMLAEARPCIVSADDAPAYRAYFASRWRIVQRDPAREMQRESSDTFPSADLAYYHFWYPDADEPIEWYEPTPEVMP